MLWSSWLTYDLIVTGKDLVKLLGQNGWELRRVNGSHHIMKKEDKILVVPVHASQDVKPGTLNSILKKAGLR